jgi:hypothetical protein
MRAAKITTDGQNLPSLGITKGSFDGYILKDKYDFGDNRGFGRFELWMIEWRAPKPVGEPYKRTSNAGWYRLAFKTGDPLAQYAQRHEQILEHQYPLSETADAFMASSASRGRLWAG